MIAFGGRRPPLQRATAPSLRRWAVAGALLGAAIAVPLFAPASWLAAVLAQATGERLWLADARGTVWDGSALPVLTGGPGSRDASALGDRLHWRVGLGFRWGEGPAVLLHATQACCLHGSVALRLQPGIGRLGVALDAPERRIGEWPTAWLAGLGTPWNTMQLGGTLRLDSPGLTLTRVAGRLQVAGSATLGFHQLSSPLSTLPVLGSYRLTLAGGAGPPEFTLTTLEGALQLSGSGSWGLHGVRFRGEARAGSGDEETVLSNLLNIIGRRDKARSVISIG